MESTFFYTFSTIAQTLAGAIALLAAFLLYRLYSLNEEIEDNSRRLASPLREVVGLDVEFMHRSGQYRELLNLAARTPLPKNYYQAEEEQARLPLLLDRKDSLLCYFRVALYLTMGLITVSVLTITMTPKLAVSYWAVWILAGAMLWFIVCMLSYVQLLRKVFE